MVEIDEDRFESWEYTQIYSKAEFLAKLKQLIKGIESGKIKIDVDNEEDPQEGPLEIPFPKQKFLCSFEYDLEPMFIDETKNKGYFGIKLFWSDLGVEKLLEEERELDRLEEMEEEDDEVDQEED